MENVLGLITAINQFSSQILLALLIVVVLLFLWILILTLFAIKTYRLQKRLFGDTHQDELREILQEHIKRVGVVQVKLNDLDKIVARLRDESFSHVQKIGLVRFNPFEDTGGDQSFALAVLDGNDDGLVVSSLHGRDRTRMYVKPVAKGGESKYPFSGEEKEAIEKARRKSG